MLGCKLANTHSIYLELMHVQASLVHAAQANAGSPFILKLTLQSHSPLLQTLDVVLKDSTGFVTSGQCCLSVQHGTAEKMMCSAMPCPAVLAGPCCVVQSAHCFLVCELSRCRSASTWCFAMTARLSSVISAGKSPLLSLVTHITYCSNGLQNLEIAPCFH